MEYVVFPDEGHGFAKQENETRGYTAILSFLDQHLKGEKTIAGDSAKGTPVPVNADSAKKAEKKK